MAKKGELVLIPNPAHGFTLDEIVQVAFARATERHTVAIMCRCCGLFFAMSRDGGITWKWLPAADVINRLQRGATIDGRTEK